ncbi:hypothetical protein DXG03_006913 [Asterophora parasitica]|uniref:SMODS and SLOG-associating 2TM effector domain-containing protein n=1 Tax=Asterophora parasitica TaxID=117018 RepID=A0A9P7G757_9AGAR|nr:hypothetical protein DXG03_006913 [Asterophora parasitica]
MPMSGHYPSYPSTSALPPQAAPLSRSTEKLEEDRLSATEVRRENASDRDRLRNSPPPLFGIDPRAASDIRVPLRSRTADTHHSDRARAGIDWIVPQMAEKVLKRSVGDRLEPTLARAHLERAKYEAKARMTGYALNAAIGLQVLLGTLTTGLSVAFTDAKKASVVTTVLGGLSTLVASYLARARGSNEPELSITRVKDLEQFIRECQAFQMDQGHVTTGEHDDQLQSFRTRFEELLGNGSG